MARLTVSQLIKRLQESPNMNAEVRFLGSATNLAGGAIAIAATNLISITAHGLIAGDRIRVVSVAGGAGLVADSQYFVIATGLTANAFKVSATDGGTELDITSDSTQLGMVKVSVAAATDPAKATPTPDAPAASLSFVSTPGVLTIL